MNLNIGGNTAVNLLGAAMGRPQVPQAVPQGGNIPSQTTSHREAPLPYNLDPNFTGVTTAIASFRASLRNLALPTGDQRTTRWCCWKISPVVCSDERFANDKDALNNAAEQIQQQATLIHTQNAALQAARLASQEEAARALAASRTETAQERTQKAAALRTIEDLEREKRESQIRSWKPWATLFIGLAAGAGMVWGGQKTFDYLKQSVASSVQKQVGY